MQGFWEKWALSKGKSTQLCSVFALVVNVDLDPENLLVHLQTWQQGNVSNQEPYNGDFEKAMASIKAKTLVLPGKTDLYFPYVTSPFLRSIR